jgi:hypothetical protein
MEEKDIEQTIEEKAKALVNKVEEKQMSTLIDEKAKTTDNVKDFIDLLATKTALEKTETVDKIVEEKGEELRNDAESKRVKAETERVNEEVKKIVAEKEKEIAELDKEISRKKAEAEQLRVDSDKAQLFFDSNADILSCIGVRKKKTLKTMYCLMIPATIIFIIIRFIALPFTILGKMIEIVIEIIGGICSVISSNALKIIISLIVLCILLGGAFCIYFFGGDFIATSCS